MLSDKTTLARYLAHGTTYREQTVPKAVPDLHQSSGDDLLEALLVRELVLQLVRARDHGRPVCRRPTRRIDVDVDERGEVRRLSVSALSVNAKFAQCMLERDPLIRLSW